MAVTRTLSLALFSATLFTACSGSPSDPTGAGAGVAGTWEYDGSQEVPHATLEGSVDWQAAGGSSVEGTFSLVERTGSAVRTLTGISAGDLLQDSIVQFGLIMDGAERQHIGLLRADSVRGEWVSLGAPAARGMFTLRRTRTGS